MAFVVPAAGTDARSRRADRRGRATPWPTSRCPAQVRIVDALPMNASNKVLKTELREWAKKHEPMSDAADDADLRAADGRVPGRRGRATRQRLLECTRDMLTTTSYRDVKVIDIAREAGTSPATFYQYFADVEAAILVLAEEMAQQGQHLTAIITDGSWDGRRRLRHVARAGRRVPRVLGASTARCSG